MTSRRVEKINKLIRQKIGELIERDLDLEPDLVVTVSKVDTSSDFRYTTLLISVYPVANEKKVLKMLQKKTRYLRTKLKKYLKTKIIPEIIFKIDHSYQEIERIEKLLEEIKNQN